jgi:hypothetical protein
MVKGLYLLTLLCLLFHLSSKSQNLIQTKFVVITFEEIYKVNVHGGQRYFWVIPYDPIKSYYNTDVYPLFLSNYTKSQFCDCMNNKATDPTLPSLQPGDYDFDSAWFAKHDFLSKFIIDKKNRKLVQTVNKIWSNGAIATISIYAIPVIGKFCSCDFAGSGQVRFGYSGPIFLASEYSEKYGEFWKTEKAKSILRIDYSKFNFRKVTYAGEK